MSTAFAPARLAMAIETAGTRVSSPVLSLRELPALLLKRLSAHDDLRDIADIDRAAIARCQKK